MTVRILDGTGRELPAGEIGDIWIESAAGPSEYYKDPAKTARMRRGRMVTLGDIGYLDEAGYLFLRDRRIDLIISGGANIYPAEVEAALLEDPLIADVAVIGIPDEEWGEQVKAIVELRRGWRPTPRPQRRSSAVGLRIAHYKCPRSVDFIEQLPAAERQGREAAATRAVLGAAPQRDLTDRTRAIRPGAGLPPVRTDSSDAQPASQQLTVTGGVPGAGRSECARR